MEKSFLQTKLTIKALMEKTLKIFGEKLMLNKLTLVIAATDKIGTSYSTNRKLSSLTLTEEIKPTILEKIKCQNNFAEYRY